MKKTLSEKLKGMGPAAIITSAFIGPGTITTATVAGANFGYELLWAVVFSGIALVILMEMSSRVGIISHMNLIDASVKTYENNKAWGIFVKTLVFLAVASVAFAFQAGNIVGASLGLGDVMGIPKWMAAVIVGGFALYTTLFGSYKVLEKIMMGFVSVMGLLFFITMLTVRPSISGIMSGIFMPSVPEGAVINTIALIGTTLIAINLILHSITSADKWKNEEDLEAAKFDINVNVMIGVVITLSIIITSGTVLYNTGAQINSPLVFSQQLEPVLGSWARIIGSFGLFAAGLSSAIAIPFTLRSIFCKLFKWEGGILSTKAKILGTVVIAYGTTLAIIGTNPIQIIIFAQAMSGFTLPFIAVLLLIVTNNKKLMGKYTNSKLQNILGTIAVLVTIGLGSWGLYNVFLRVFG